MHETTALGAAIAAGFAIDIWKEFDELKHMNRANRTIFYPKISEIESAKMYKQWTKAVEMSRGWLDTSEIDSWRTPYKLCQFHFPFSLWVTQQITLVFYGVLRGEAFILATMCDHTQVNYKCGHHRFLVIAWCTIYARTGKICPLNVVIM